MPNATSQDVVHRADGRGALFGRPEAADSVRLPLGGGGGEAAGGVLYTRWWDVGCRRWGVVGRVLCTRRDVLRCFHEPRAARPLLVPNPRPTLPKGEALSSFRGRRGASVPPLDKSRASAFTGMAREASGDGVARKTYSNFTAKANIRADAHAGITDCVWRVIVADAAGVVRFAN